MQTIADLGVSTFIVKERALNPGSSLLPYALGLVSLSGAGVMILSAVALLFANQVTNDSEYLQLLPLAVWCAAEKNTEAWLGIPLADGRARVNAVNQVFRRTMALVLFIVLVALDSFPALFAFAISYAVAAIGALCLAWYQSAKNAGVNFGFEAFRTVLVSSRSYWANSIGAQLRNLDAIVVTSIGGPSVGGFYGAASRLTGPLGMVSSALATVLMPAVASRQFGRITHTLRMLWISIAGFAVLYTGLAWTLPPLVPTLLGSEYVEAEWPVRIALMGLIFASAASLMSAVLQGWNRQRIVAAVSITCTILCLALCAIGAIVAGAVGASWGLAASFGIQVSILGYFVGRTQRILQER
ncbi:O-antigen/teichoic acid export membrane protein [Paeniglutamicibacter psychrophenolicus]|nr:O-antigen/teichoic acid export membrane protein [Paeniglutamicibacter psychrophenolicus]